MKHFSMYEKKIYSLISSDDNYIIFNDGKAIRSNVDESVEITVDETFDKNDFTNRVNSVEENIINNSPFTTFVHINKPIDLKIIRINDETEYNNIVFDINKHIKVNIIYIYLQLDIKTNTLINVICQEKSDISFLNIQSSNCALNERINFYLDDKANVNYNSLLMNKNEVNNEANFYMYRPFASLSINNSIINNTSIKQKYNFNVYHDEKDTTSNLLNYAICKNSSSLDVSSNGIIKKGSSRSVLSQKSRGIILDLKSSISANPKLCIDEFDVVANHGASIGAIDDEDLYYLMSRGLSKEMSESLIVLAYVNPLLDKVKDEIIKEYMQKELINKL